MQPLSAENPYAPPEAELTSGQQSRASVPISDIAAFVHEKLAAPPAYVYYLELWRKRPLGRRMGFNFAAFFLGSTWCFYRKRYAMGLLLIVASSFASLIVTVSLVLTLGMESTIPRIAGWGIGLIVGGVFGSIANGVYLSAAARASHLARARHTSEEAVRRELVRRGGTSGVGLCLGLALSLMLGLLGALFR